MAEGAAADDVRMTRSLTAIFAHPDDETFATGATLARYADEGVRLSVYCATDGDIGRSSDIPVSSRAELGARRRDELRAAAQVLGITELSFGGHPDGALAATDPEVVLSEIVTLLRRERPQVVLTFGPEGAPTQHRDHRAISRLATSAFLLAGTRTAFASQLDEELDPHRASRLCYVTWPSPDPASIYQTHGQPSHLAIDARPWSARKLDAFLAHATQRQHQSNFERYSMADAEHYFVAIGTPLPRGAMDLFAGLTQ